MAVVTTEKIDKGVPIKKARCPICNRILKSTRMVERTNKLTRPVIGFGCPICTPKIMKQFSDGQLTDSFKLFLGVDENPLPAQEIQRVLECIKTQLGTRDMANTVWELIRLYNVMFQNDLPANLPEVLNEVTTSDNFFDVADRYGLDVLKEFNFTCLSEKDGIEVWGRTADGKFLVYDNNDGWYFLPVRKWIKEVQDFLSSAHNYEFDGLLTLDELKECLKACDAEQPYNEI